MSVCLIDSTGRLSERCSYILQSGVTPTAAGHRSVHEAKSTYRFEFFINWLVKTGVNTDDQSQSLEP